MWCTKIDNGLKGDKAVRSKLDLAYSSRTVHRGKMHQPSRELAVEMDVITMGLRSVVVCRNHLRWAHACAVHRCTVHVVPAGAHGAHGRMHLRRQRCRNHWASQVGMLGFRGLLLEIDNVMLVVLEVLFAEVVDDWLAVLLLLMGSFVPGRRLVRVVAGETFCVNLLS